MTLVVWIVALILIDTLSGQTGELNGPASLRYHGCFEFDRTDDYFYGATFLVPDTPSMTIGKCIDACLYTYNHFYAGLYFDGAKNMTQCVCANFIYDLDRSQLGRPSLDCHSADARKCSGNQSQFCGTTLKENGAKASAAWYKGIADTELDVQVIGHSFRLYVNGELILHERQPLRRHSRVRTQRVQTAALYIEHATREELDSMPNYGTSVPLTHFHGFMFNVDKTVTRDKWLCQSEDNYEDFSKTFPDWFEYDPNSFSPDTVSVDNTHVADYQMFNGRHFQWIRPINRKSDIVCRLDLRCPHGNSTGGYGYGCSRVNSQCEDSAVHSVTGHCLKTCKSGFGPFCVPNHPSSDQNPGGPCPFCSHCANDLCVGTGPGVFYDCPHDWDGRCLACVDGEWGDECEKSCNETCKRCEVVDGGCNECEIDFYGETCELDCPTGCRDRGCEKDSGRCWTGCKFSLYGDHCLQNCSMNCAHKCTDKSSDCRECFEAARVSATPEVDRFACNARCNHTCTMSCDQGEGTCDPCIGGFYGQRCEKACPNCTSCDKKTGKCKNECQPGFYKKDCDQYCPQNCMSSCDRENGTCLNCTTGFYGPECNLSCPRNCKDNVCNQDDGSCGNGCINGFYGEICEAVCNSSCKTPKCAQSTGKCLTGCKTGFHGDLCNQSCPNSCINQFCNQSNGHCTVGCKTGFTGPDCSEDCPEFCQDGCHWQSGHCRSCMEGYYGNTCTICPVDCQLSCTNGNSLTFALINETVTGEMSILLAGTTGIIIVGILLVSMYVHRRKNAPRRKKPPKQVESEPHSLMWDSETSMPPVNCNS